MTPPQDGASVAREMLLRKYRRLRCLRKRWDEAAMTRRISRMSDEQVFAALALSKREIRARAKAKPDPASRWAPATGDKPVRLWDHVDMG
ncbi:hypothetical protein [Streptomyces formicae]|uniref:DUF1127 domain-containing protein n=1 Tax=Streptomyces formicae TaxID=1616117 RepID=A0ABY3WMA3_9ACTN|nr:hypothetical protein [Streptomyces formicae]UNM13744.1 hypothetical protein J4032_21850 [Streptomyces formicae]